MTAVFGLEPFPLRGLLWCGPCGLPMASGLWQAGRVYGCSSCCGFAGRRVDAPAVERLVWDRLAGCRPGLEAGVPVEGRRAVLADALLRVVVAADPGVVRLVWAWPEPDGQSATSPDSMEAADAAVG